MLAARDDRREERDGPTHRKKEQSARVREREREREREIE